MPETTPVTLDEVETLARRLNTTPRHVYLMVKEERIPVIRVGKLLRFDPAQIDAWIADNTTPAKVTKADAEALVARTTAAQGLPTTVTDEAALRRIAAVLDPGGAT